MILHFQSNRNRLDIEVEPPLPNVTDVSNSRSEMGVAFFVASLPKALGRARIRRCIRK
jgi:hypothetical protein